jgi:hypothetical protein
MILLTYRLSLLYYRQFIDDVLAIWIPPPNFSTKSVNAAWIQFKADLTFGILEWETEDLAHSMNFLDLTISIDNKHWLQTRTFQKAMNLCMYLCPSSTHPPGVLKGLIFGSVHRFWLQNSDPDQKTTAKSSKIYTNTFAQEDTLRKNLTHSSMKQPSKSI